MARTSSLGSGGSFNGVPSLGYLAGVGATYPPHWATLTNANALATTINRLYYIPYYFESLTAFTGLKLYNNNTGDNGDKCRAGVYQRSPTTFLPTSLIVDAGEVTFTGAAAIRTLAQSFTPAYVGWHYIAVHFNAAVDMQWISTQEPVSTVGVTTGFPAKNIFGVSTQVLQSYASTFGAYYVDTAYGALASTAVAPTAISTQAPSVAPYIT